MARTDKLKTLIPLHEIEYPAQQQIYAALERDEVLKLAIMPDCHVGYDLPVGAVALTDGCISPGYVGYDIGCGMCSVMTGLPWQELVPQEWQRRKALHDRIHDEVPVGFARHSARHTEARPFRSASGDRQLTARVEQYAGLQLGTLGGGNHFIELGRNLAGELCLTVHSGSRRAGYEVGEYYMRQAQALKLKFLPLDSELGQAYLQDMNFFLQFALDNRLTMVRAVLGVLGFSARESASLIAGSLINENHNHAVVTGEGVIHRKGATPADLGQLGVIPGNMRDGTYITRGLGNAEFLSSASHGAGRIMGRRAARERVTLEAFKRAMQGFDVYAEVSEATIDESPLVYKDVADVIAYQEHVVLEVVDHITPLVSVKGGEG